MINFFKKHKFCLSAVLLGIVLFAMGFWANFLFSKPSAEKKSEISRSDNFHFINSDIIDKESPIISKAEYVVLKNELLHFIDSQKASGNVSDVSLYFRDLKNGPIFGINDQEEFAPASLLKLPIAFVFFNLEEEQPGFIQKQLLFKETIPSDYVSAFPSAVSPKKNQPYPIETLLNYILTYSDNISYQMLVGYLNETPGGSEKIIQTFQELGIVDPKNDSENTLTVRGYASLFRLLFNSSYFNNENSEKILSWLSRSDFNTGLVSGVPEGVAVAHKFGERQIENSDIKQLHDCGIVYYPDNPYLLCIMTRGKDMNNLSEIIKIISGKVYKEVDSRKL